EAQRDAIVRYETRAPVEQGAEQKTRLSRTLRADDEKPVVADRKARGMQNQIAARPRSLHRQLAHHAHCREARRKISRRGDDPHARAVRIDDVDGTKALVDGDGMPAVGCPTRQPDRPTVEPEAMNFVGFLSRRAIEPMLVL